MSQVSKDVGRSWGSPVVVVCAALLVAVIVAACEEPLPTAPVARIAGRITLDGRPLLPGFSVIFMEPRRGDLAFGITDINGGFRVNSWKNGEMPPGRYKVYVRPPQVEDVAHDGFADQPPRSEVVREVAVDYASEYSDVQSTPLEFKVVPGDNYFEVELSCELPKRERNHAPEPSAAEVTP